jgi:spermidine/putrescine transport system ATP-binding protein
MQIALSVKKVTRTFADFVAVNNVSFEVTDGSFFSILGPSGCGKTTLLRMIAGLTEPTSGTIEIRGKSMLGISPNKRPVNLIFQHLALFPMMNVGENIAFGLRRRGEARATIKKKVKKILERVDLTGFGSKKIDQLS